MTDLAYSHDGAFLAVCDASKVVTVFSVADGYAVSGRLSCVPVAGRAGGGWGPRPFPPVTNQVGAREQATLLLERDRRGADPAVGAVFLAR